MAVNETMEKRYSLAEWLRIFHPVYRNFLIAMVALGIVGGILTYLNLELLQGLVQTFTAVGRLGTMTCDGASDLFLLTRIMVCGGVSPGWAIAGIVLLVYVCLELSQAALGIVSLVVQSKLEITSRNDIEREILLNLMRKDDQFFQRQSATQIANRLEEDTQRMFERREDMAGLWSVFVQALGAIVFLWSQNWSYAAAVLVFSLVGVFIIHRMLGVMRTLDNEQLTSDDNVKAAFEDYLYAVPEAQMGNLSHKIAGQLGHIQGARQTAYMGLVWLNGKLGAVYSITQLVAFTAIMGAIAYVVIVHGFDLRDGLIAAVVRAVPQLYGNISEVAKLVVKFQLAGVSARRLLEYETEFDKVQQPIALAEIGPSTIVLDHVHYAFTPGGPQQGGPEGISLSLAPDELIVVMGPSGSGKTMLCQLIMGRLRALGGTVHYGDQDIGELSQANRARIFSYMPQTLAMVTGSIRDNLNFGLPQELTIPEGTMSDETRAWIDRTGVGLFAREKALDLQPDESAVAVIEGIGALRQQLRQHIKAELGVELVPFTARTLVPHLSILEYITHSAADPDKVARLAFSRVGFKFLDRMANTPSADAIIGFGQHVVARTQRILSRCPSYDSYTELAPYQISEEVWGLRSDLASRPEIDLEELATRSEVLLAGLTATPQEADEAFAKSFANALESGEGFQALVAACTKHFGTALETLDDDRLNLSMSWRDNLLFSAPNAVNASLARAIDQKLIEAVAETTLDHELLRGGLEYQVGRQGKRLSGGQRQLICLCRALMRDTPVLVLDEPTAALDPRRRQEMNALLHEIAGKRTVIAITHDAELARVADNVVMVRSGQLWGTGSFSNLCEENADFRRLVRLEEAPVR